MSGSQRVSVMFSVFTDLFGFRPLEVPRCLSLSILKIKCPHLRFRICPGSVPHSPCNPFFSRPWFWRMWHYLCRAPLSRRMLLTQWHLQHRAQHASSANQNQFVVSPASELYTSYASFLITCHQILALFVPIITTLSTLGHHSPITSTFL
ncbi:hypothetical protein BD779DRAFT_963862 [Infundibulicybe gibba]|nr:hypothetical protein BD779DRAFT_963862 [Infundibulicybe gibba]